MWTSMKLFRTLEFECCKIILQSLDTRITHVATKVVHLGEQLENMNEPKRRAQDALTLMKHFNELVIGEGVWVYDRHIIIF